MKDSNIGIKKDRDNFRKWETALLLALCVTLCVGAWALREQSELSSKLIRLHVIAASDSDEDQAVKLAVRDRVQEILAPELESAQSRTQAEETVFALLPLLEREASEAAMEMGAEVPVTATLTLESYPTRYYEDFSLPAGEYMSLRVVLGEGEGKNWWCVVFPPLCMSAVGEDVSPAGSLTDSDVSLITEESEGYIIKFKLLEIIGRIREYLEY